jgi:hypothetical protein
MRVIAASLLTIVATLMLNLASGSSDLVMAHAAGGPVATPAIPAPKGAGPDYYAFVKNGKKPVVTPIDKMTQSTVGFATEISPPITEANCYSPPTNFDLSKASAADLKKYGIPGPDKGESKATWLAKSSWMKVRDCVSYQTNAAPHTITSTKAKATPLTSEFDSTYWDGNVADQTCGLGCSDNSYTYTETDADWYVPCITINTSMVEWGDSSQWLGIGGTGGYNDQLVQDGSDSEQTGWLSGDTSYDQWYEYVGTFGTIDPVEVDLGPNFTKIGCGVHVYSKVYGNPQCYELGDINTDHYYTKCTGPEGNQATAEGIVERNGQANGWGLAQFNSATFYGFGITEAVAGYQPMNNLHHDYLNMVWNGGSLATTGPIQNDPGDIPYDKWTVTWHSACGNQLTCY